MNYIYLINTDSNFIFIVIRSVLIYVYGIFLFRIGNTRFRLQSPFDFVLIFLLSAIYGKAIFEGPLFQAMAVTLLLIIIHRIFARLAIEHPYFDYLIKGKTKSLLINGQINWQEMRKNGISQNDLEELCRKEFKREGFTDIEKTILERSGEITFIKKSTK